MTALEASEQPPSVNPRPLPKKSYSNLSPQKLSRFETTSLCAASDSEGSELTPLPSPLETTGNSDGKPEFREKLNPLSPNTPKRRAAPHLVDLDPWKVENLGTYVWVLLDRRARVLEPEDVDNPDECHKERLWWPGKVRFSHKNHSSWKLKFVCPCHRLYPNHQEPSLSKFVCSGRLQPSSRASRSILLASSTSCH